MHIIDTTDILVAALSGEDFYKITIGIQQGKLYLHTKADWITEAQSNIAHAAGWMVNHPAQAANMIQLVQCLDKAFQVLVILHEGLQAREERLIRQARRGPHLGYLD